MKKYCKKTDITNPDVIFHWVWDCCNRHKKRYDFKKLLTGDFDDAVKRICVDACEKIKNRDLELEKPSIRIMLDSTTLKVREIGKESAMQQIFDYIAVYSAMDIFRARMVIEQASSIPNRGQIYGKNMIQKWIKEDNYSKEYAENHNYHYHRKCTYFCKLDIKKCYPSANTDRFLDLFEKDCGNKDIVWLWTELLHSHRVDGYTGFMIGALPSQWACQYMISYIYRFAKMQGKQRRNVKIKAVNHMLLFMDDMLLIGSNRNQLKKAIERTIAYTKAELGWDIKPNWHIRELDKFNIDMMGFVIHKDGSCTIRARNFIKMRRMWLRSHDHINYQQAKRILSYKGFCDHSDSKKIISKYNVNSIWNKSIKIVKENEKCNQ